jgi:hypothetical protein
MASELIQVKMLVNTTEGDTPDGLSEETRREMLHPEFVDGYVAIEEIVEFHANIKFPYETIINFYNGDVCVIKSEVHEFKKEYDRINNAQTALHSE